MNIDAGQLYMVIEANCRKFSFTQPFMRQPYFTHVIMAATTHKWYFHSSYEEIVEKFLWLTVRKMYPWKVIPDKKLSCKRAPEEKSPLPRCLSPRNKANLQEIWVAFKAQYDWIYYQLLQLRGSLAILCLMFFSIWCTWLGSEFTSDACINSISLLTQASEVNSGLSQAYKMEKNS